MIEQSNQGRSSFQVDWSKPQNSLRCRCAHAYISCTSSANHVHACM